MPPVHHDGQVQCESMPRYGRWARNDIAESCQVFVQLRNQRAGKRHKQLRVATPPRVCSGCEATHNIAGIGRAACCRRSDRCEEHQARSSSLRPWLHLAIAMPSSNLARLRARPQHLAGPQWQEPISSTIVPDCPCQKRAAGTRCRWPLAHMTMQRGRCG